MAKTKTLQCTLEERQSQRIAATLAEYRACVERAAAGTDDPEDMDHVAALCERLKISAPDFHLDVAQQKRFDLYAHLLVEGPREKLMAELTAKAKAASDAVKGAEDNLVGLRQRRSAAQFELSDTGATYAQVSGELLRHPRLGPNAFTMVKVPS